MRLSTLLLLIVLPFTVLASPLDDARDAGHIVELADGFVKATASATKAARDLATEVNRKRRQAYQRIADRHGITVEQVGRESYVKRMGDKSDS